ncbi:response regulator [Pseudoprimorskyibacter insulae]|uniref:Transcriptional regulatory protein DegU n=1 Tax=Pseudoprimorskyibacter insulae TaxID=1695997 RepID=A0A2R8B0U5_9RHOB|nr:response regulator transcription factor [Pseudoprimorskyibacter insulae]SPF81847.1 Transcriptional regulatory protein DegU [Pseudoprimorskyibacter insulae]
MTEQAALQIPPAADHVLVVDDHPLFCDALILTLRSIWDFRTIDTASTLDQALEHLKGGSGVGFIVLDLNLPDVDGLDGLMRLRNAAKDAIVLVVSSMADNRMIARTIQAGANGFVPKHSQRTVFRQAIERVVAGDIYLPGGYVEPDTGEDHAGSKAARLAVTRLASLTNQQARILSLLCEGRLNKQIAYDLSIAETTVKAHVTAIMRKLGVHSRTQAVLIAQEARFNKVLPLPDEPQ